MISTTGPTTSSRTVRPAGALQPTLRGGQGGFTLIELVLVLLLVSVVLTLAAPSLRGFFASRKTADAATTMLSLTKWARSSAIAQARPCRLNIDATSGQYWLTVQDGGTFTTMKSDMGRQFDMPEGARVTLQVASAGLSQNSAPTSSLFATNTSKDVSTQQYIQFYPSGRSDVATIEIRGMQGETYTVLCSSATEPYRIASPSEMQRQ